MAAIQQGFIDHGDRQRLHIFADAGKEGKAATEQLVGEFFADITFIAEEFAGYRSRIVIDEVRAPLVRRMFTEYATGTVSLRELQRKTFEWGMRTDRGNTLALQTVCDIISNPFYYGVMKVKGKLYRHNYPALIEKPLFDLCQAIKDGMENKPWKAVKQTRENFLLRGMISCAVSGKKVTCDLKKGKYIYLMAHDPANPSQKLWVKESVVMGQIREIFASFALPEEALPEMLTYVRKTHEMEKAFHQEHTRALHLEKNTLTGKLDRLTDLLLEGDITKEVYDRKHQEITSRRDDINQQLAASDTGDSDVKMAISFIVSLVAKTPRLFESSKMDEKRKLLGLVFSNLQLEGPTLRYTLRKPFDLFAGTLNRQEWCGREDSNFHEISPTATSTLRVYQFRHDRTCPSEVTSQAHSRIARRLSSDYRTAFMPRL